MLQQNYGNYHNVFNKIQDNCFSQYTIVTTHFCCLHFILTKLKIQMSFSVTYCWHHSIRDFEDDMLFSNMCYLRNRSALAVIYWVINHCLEVSCKVDQITSAEREWFIFLQLTDKLWFITQQITHKSWSISILTHRKRRKGNCIL